jgi:uncharacterized protein (UPF0276 family)
MDSIPAAAGVGLRPQHHDWVIQHRPGTAWFEVQPEAFIGNGPLRSDLEMIGRHYPLSLHGVGLSIGSVNLPEYDHLQQLRELALRFEPDLVSDHLSWSNVAGMHLPDLLPLPYTDEALHAVVRNVHRVQEVLERQILLENPVKQAGGPQSKLREAEFLSEVVLRTGCGVLLDINNLYVSAINEGSCPVSELEDFLATLPLESFGEIHLGSSACPEVRALYQRAIGRLGAVPTLIEWDTGIADFALLQAEAAVAQALMDQYSPEGGAFAVAV